jgi:hypothetical protein
VRKRTAWFFLVDLFLLVEKTTVVLDAANRRHGSGRNLNQVETAFPGNSQSLKWLHDTELFAVFIDYADLAGANPVIDTNKGLCCTFVESDGTPPFFGVCLPLRATSRRRPENGPTHD